MPNAARLTDVTSHGSPLSPGPGSPTVFVGRLAAWRALPAGVVVGLEAASNAMSTMMLSPTLTPVDATAALAQAQVGFTQAASAAAAEGAPQAVAATASAFAALSTTNVTLTAAYIAAASVPGGAAAAATAYTEAIKAAASAAAGAAMNAIGAMTDIHSCPLPCPTPPHGPGVVTRGSASVFVNKLPAARRGDSLFEACGGADSILLGSPNVFIGDAGGGASAAGTGMSTGDAVSSAAAAESAVQAAAIAAKVAAASTVTYQNKLAARTGAALCEICEIDGEGG